MQLDMVLSHVQVEPATSSIFPKVDKYVDEHDLEDLPLRNADDYYSIVDCLFCETFPHFRQACFDYYNGEGPMLKDTINKAEVVFYETCLLKLLKVAEKKMK